MKAVFRNPPCISMGLSDIASISRQFIGKLSISGVQKKLSLKLDRATNSLLPATVGGEYILKPQLDQWPCVPENENLTMDLASLVGIPVADHGILHLSDGTIAYIVRRFDRENGRKIAFEDFSQLLGLPSEEKYNVSVERMSSVIDLFSVAPGLDKMELFKLVLFNFLIGNSDAHTKNYGLLKYPHGYRLSLAYDLVNTHLIIPDDKDETALTINGKKRNLKRSDFDVLAECLKLSDKAISHIYATLRKLQAEASAVIEGSSLPANLQKRYQDILFKNSEKIWGG